MLDIKNVAVLGTGVMGSQIAAHCANADYIYQFKSPGAHLVMLLIYSQEISESGHLVATFLKKIKPKA